MIGNKLEITTKSIGEGNEPTEVIRFAIDGPHEIFYYLKPNELDLEKIGTHGTIIKIY